MWNHLSFTIYLLSVLWLFGIGFIFIFFGKYFSQQINMIYFIGFVCSILYMFSYLLTQQMKKKNDANSKV